MLKILAILFSFAIFCISMACSVAENAASKPLPDPAPVAAATPKTGSTMETAVFAGGCFWGVDAVYKHVKGVIDVKSGYAGGSAKTAEYDRVSEGDTGHAESVRVEFNPQQVSYDQLLKIFFSVVHDPTELNRQGPDTGSQYRSAIFYTSEDQKKAALDYITQLTNSKAFSKPIVTQVVPLKDFYMAEDYHQNYLANHPDQPYIVINDIPKVENLKKEFPDLYVEK
ncbi:MAG TPA: peptide-methionine (S)-S-oxide reductase MsrA [Pyrinomonadaceae bacterium]|jgi:peptide-methionine (S)-S-oxide reductase|nr:peptide-methionine (S)-S-oxide reductase MsrA [Pyrinomonadaceae bacterium]